MTQTKTGGWYSHYVLFVLVLVYIFNFIDRNILSILAEDIKADLLISDAQMGFLYGTVFAVFYAVFGIPLARFADVWNRRSLIAFGLSFWSFMTAASGLARSFGMLAICRVGVGIGEASASPAAYSMLSDYYPPRLRATVIAIYAAGVYIGAGIGIFLGGYILDAWAAAYPVDAPYGLKGWQVAFMAVGIPGLILAVWVRTLREPTRGFSEGLVTPKHPFPFKVLGSELMAVLPPFNLLSLRGHPGVLTTNLSIFAAMAVVAWGLIQLTGSTAQWITTAFGAWITLTWAQSLKIRDPVTYNMMFGSRAFVYILLAFPLTAFVGYGAGFWIPPLLLRLHDVPVVEVGLYLGIGAAAGGFLGITLGGMLADKLKQKYPSGRLVLGYVVSIGKVPLLLAVIYSETLLGAYIFNFFFVAISASGGGVPPSTASDLVLPRMRAVAGAYYILMNTFLGLALGPYVMGELSDMFLASGMDEAGALRTAIAVSCFTLIPAVIFLYLGQRHLPADEASRIDRARALGEPEADLRAQT